MADAVTTSFFIAAFPYEAPKWQKKTKNKCGTRYNVVSTKALGCSELLCSSSFPHRFWLIALAPSPTRGTPLTTTIAQHRHQSTVKSLSGKKATNVFCNVCEGEGGMQSYHTWPVLRNIDPRILTIPGRSTSASHRPRARGKLDPPIAITQKRRQCRYYYRHQQRNGREKTS